MHRTDTDTVADSQFDLLRRFLLLGFIAISLASAVSGALMSRFLTNRLLQRDAEVTRDFVQNVMDIELAKGYSLDRPEAAKGLVDFLEHIAAMPDVVRANVYSKDAVLLWSSENSLRPGKKYGLNPELAGALDGKLEIESGEVGERARAKAEHVNLGKTRMRFVEMYIPMRNAGSGAIIGVVEIYRIPHALSQAINSGTRLTWMISLGIGLFLFLVLFWIVQRADQHIRAQQERLIESETMVAVGEMASAIAHGIRNPLSSVRSSAELWHDTPGAIGAESARDIIADVDRIDQRIRALLTCSALPDYRPEAIDPRALIQACVAGFDEEMKQKSVTLALSLPHGLPRIRANSLLLMQVLNNLVSNALDAMPAAGGAIVIAGTSLPGKREVAIAISDTGSGIDPAHITHLGQPFFTTKAKGLGVGLTLVRRIVRRFGGRIHIESAHGKGTVITLGFLSA